MPSVQRGRAAHDQPRQHGSNPSEIQILKRIGGRRPNSGRRENYLTLDNFPSVPNSASVPQFVSKHQHQTELDGPRDTQRARNQTSRRSALPARVEHLVCRIGEVGMIEDVEEFRTKLEILVFQERGALQEREVDIVEAWTD